MTLSRAPRRTVGTTLFSPTVTPTHGCLPLCPLWWTVTLWLEEALEILTAAWSGAPVRHRAMARHREFAEQTRAVCASSQAGGSSAGCVPETPPSAAQDARGAEGRSS